MRRFALTALLLAACLALPRPALRAADDPVTFARDVAPIFYSKCATCHRAGEVAPMSLLSYEEVRPWARSIKARVVSRQMPPWFADPHVGVFANDPRLTDAEIATIAKWVDAGAPQGDPKQTPKAPKFTEGWQLGEPDQIVELPEVQIPATGPDYFPTPTVTPALKEDRWIRAIEIRPSNRQVTHHSVIFSTSGNFLAASGLFDVLGVWAVGTPPTVYPEGTGRWIRKGQMLRTNLHYHPNGTPQVDRTRIGLYFGKGELRKEVAAALAGNVNFRIPPNAPDFELKSAYVVDQDIDIVSFFPHMHLRGKDMAMTATFPDGHVETLLSVPAYDFSWQMFYYPKARVALPKGTRIDLVAHYDNSAANKRNPDPTRTISFGEASTSEMMFGMFEFTAAAGVSPVKSSDRARMEMLVSTFPADSSFLIDLPGGLQRQQAVLYVPRQGDAAFYTQILGMLLPLPAANVKWTGDSFEFTTFLQTLGPSGLYSVTGTITDGVVRGRFEPVAAPGFPAQRPFDYSGRHKS